MARSIETLRARSSRRMSKSWQSIYPYLMGEKPRCIRHSAPRVGRISTSPAARLAPDATVNGPCPPRNPLPPQPRCIPFHGGHKEPRPPDSLAATPAPLGAPARWPRFVSALPTDRLVSRVPTQRRNRRRPGGFPPAIHMDARVRDTAVHNFVRFHTGTLSESPSQDSAICGGRELPSGLADQRHEDFLCYLFRCAGIARHL